MSVQAVAQRADGRLVAEAARRFAGGVAWPTLALAGVSLCAYAATIWMVLAGALPLGWGVAVNAVLAFVIFTPLHEAVHGNVSGHRAGLAWLDEVVGYACGAVLWMPHGFFRAVHLTHHAYVNHPQRDPDLWVEGDGVVRVALRAASLLPHYVWHLAARGDLMDARPRARRRAWMEMGVLVAAGVLLSVLASAKAVLLLWLAPSLIAMVALAVLFDWLPHRPHATQDWLRSTRIILVPGLQVPMLWQNYHLIHHVLPNVPFWRYARVFDVLADFLARRGAMIEAPFGDARANAPGAAPVWVAAPAVSRRMAAQAVTFGASGRTVMAEAGETILEAALRHGIRHRHGCKSGNCGACKCELAVGSVTMKSYSDYALTDEERDSGFVLACRAVPESGCVLKA